MNRGKWIAAMGLAAVLSISAAPVAMAAEEVVVQEGQDITYQSYKISESGNPFARYGTVKIRRSSWEAFVEYYHANIEPWATYVDPATGKSIHDLNLEKLTQECFRDGYDTLAYQLKIEIGDNYRTTGKVAGASDQETVTREIPHIDAFIFDEALRIQENEYVVGLEFSVMQGLPLQGYGQGHNFSLLFNGTNYTDCYLGTESVSSPGVTYVFIRVPHGYREDEINWILRSKYYATPEDAANGRISEKNYTYHFLGNGTAQAVEDGWQQSADGRWWVKAGDGWLHDQWYVDGGKEYYLDSEGYMLRDADTPDGGRVGADGAQIR